MFKRRASAAALCLMLAVASAVRHAPLELRRNIPAAANAKIRMEAEEEENKSVQNGIVFRHSKTYSPAQCERELKALHEHYPDQTELSRIGTSVLGQPIWALSFGAAAETAKTRVLVQAGMHGREWINVQIAMAQIEDYLGQEQYAALLRETALVFVPMCNPDGVRIAQARYPASLYPGDIEFIAKGGNVQIVVHVYMEDYMLGVLPYEMDNSFPLEALKAQAVAARTYALKKMSVQAATYDVVDTTSDQVYNGTPSGNARCAQAVQETSGIVGTVGGEYMASYYTASNGGQTESVKNAWGSGSYSYLQVKDDPYDLRNGASIAKSVTFYRNGTTSVSALTELLRTEAAMLVGAGSVEIASISGVTLAEPKYGEPSRVYKKVLVNLTLSGYGDVSVALDYFSQVEGLCSMSINVLKNETLTVTEAVGGYKLTARRFGHGVGMSQRGAQQMAKEGESYKSIINFYFDGVSLPTIDFKREELTRYMPIATKPIAQATVTSSTLRVRSDASSSSAKLGTLSRGTTVDVYANLGDWLCVSFNGSMGYISASYVTLTDYDGSEVQPTSTPDNGGNNNETAIGQARVTLSTASSTLKLRKSPSSSAAVLTTMANGMVVDLLADEGAWLKVRTPSGVTGYASAAYLRVLGNGTTSEPTATATATMSSVKASIWPPVRSR